MAQIRSTSQKQKVRGEILRNLFSSRFSEIFHPNNLLIKQIVYLVWPDQLMWIDIHKFKCNWWNFQLRGRKKKITTPFLKKIKVFHSHTFKMPLCLKVVKKTSPFLWIWSRSEVKTQKKKKSYPFFRIVRQSKIT